MSGRVFSACLFLLISTPVFAVNVTVTVQNGDVRIIGDDYPDSLVIQSIFDGQLIISGRKTGPFDMWPTLINGRSTPLVVDIEDDLIIDLGAGESELDIRNLYMYRTNHSDITVKLGNANDTFIAHDVINSGIFKVEMGSGRDFCEAFDIVANQIVLWQGRGSGLFNVAYTNSTTFILSSGRDADTAYLGDVSTIRMEVDFGSGDDRTYLMPGIHADRNSYIDGGSGYDRRTNWFKLLWYFHGDLPGYEVRGMSFTLGF